jgi:hypothetical protein
MLPDGGLRSDGDDRENFAPAAGDAVTAEAVPGTFEEFWPVYLFAHGRPGTRALHFAGTSLGLLLLGAAALLDRLVLLVWALAGAYALAWVGHFVVERNRPATFRHPLWSLRSGFRMYGLIWRGKLGGELERLGIAPSGR